jgi:hypothetical protein
MFWYNSSTFSFLFATCSELLEQLIMLSCVIYASLQVGELHVAGYIVFACKDKGVFSTVLLPYPQHTHCQHNTAACCPFNFVAGW